MKEVELPELCLSFVRVAASLLKQDPEPGNIKAKRLTAAWDPDYLRQVLQGFKPNKTR
jgi:hypothetical protein